MIEKEQLILVIEDDEDIRKSLRTALEFEGYQVKTAVNGREGMQALLSCEAFPALVLLDWMMPVMDGQEFLDAKSQDPALSDLPVIVVSAAGDRIPIPASVPYLKKPLDLDELCALIKQEAVPAKEASRVAS